jgi:DNA invertase Pin-like site-specific DNA recombinase
MFCVARRSTVIKRQNCAIYTRKSSDEGLEKEFNSLDAQREACEAFVVSQKHAGWALLPQQYDDGGLSGGTMDRPALKRLLADTADGRVQIIVVYKVDRLTRSLADFAKIVDVLDAHGASFVSVTQQFNTTTSMGRLTLNMLLSFAQFEREIAGERIRDKIAASKAKGMWMGGNVPLGYDVRERKLIMNEAEAETVCLIFRRYAELGSVRLLAQELGRLGVVSKCRAGAGGSLAGGTAFTRGALYTLLQNRLYRGEIAHQGKIYPGQHDAIVDLDLWDRVQARLEQNRQIRTLGTTADEPSLLAGLVVDGNGERMTPSHASKAGRRYRYYVSAPLITGTRSDTGRGWRIPAGDIEALVLDRLSAFLASEQELGAALSSVDLDATEIVEGMRSAARLVQEWPNMAPTKARELVLSLVDSIIVREEAVAMSLKCGEVPAILLGGKRSEVSNAATGTFELHIPAKLRRAGKGIKLALGGGIKKPDNKMIALLREAHTAREALLSGRDDTIDAMAQRLGVRRDSLSTLIRLTYLAPDIIKALIESRSPESLTPNYLLQLSKDLPHDWQQQRQTLGFLSQLPS